MKTKTKAPSLVLWVENEMIVSKRLLVVDNDSKKVTLHVLEVVAEWFETVAKNGSGFGGFVAGVICKIAASVIRGQMKKAK